MINVSTRPVHLLALQQKDGLRGEGKTMMPNSVHAIAAAFVLFAAGGNVEA
jgi:hypothetical protein